MAERMKHIEQAWGLPVPETFSTIYERDDFDSFRKKDGKAVELPSPLLTPKEIINQASLRDDWEIPDGLIPFMGDMHDLVCLDSTTSEICVVLLNDERSKVRISDTFEKFISGVYLSEPTENKTDGVIEEESWLDF